MENGVQLVSGVNWGEWKIAVGPLVRAWCAALLVFRLGGSGRVFLGGRGEDLGGTWSTKNPRNTTSIQYAGYKEKQNRDVIRILTETRPRRINYHESTRQQRDRGGRRGEKEERRRRR